MKYLYDVSRQNKMDCSKVDLAEYCYLVYFSLMLFIRGIGLHEGMEAYNIAFVIGMLLFGCKILLTKHSVYEYCWMFLFLTLGFTVYHNTGEKGLLLYITMMIGIKGVSMKRVFHVGLFTWIISFAGIQLATLTGLISEVYLMHTKNGIGYIICYSMGYPHPNVLHIAYLILSMFVMYNLQGKEDKRLYFVSIILFLGNLYIFIYSVSFTGFIVTTMFLLVNFYFWKREHFSLLEKIAIQMIFPFCAFFSLLGPIMIKGKVFDIINKILNTRFNLARYFLTQQPITLFGTRFIVPNYRYTMDSSYVYAFMQLGVITFLLICIIYITLINNYIKECKRTELAIILCICIAGLTEPFLFNLAYKNLIFLFAGEFLYRMSDRFFARFPKTVSIQIIKKGKMQVQSKYLVFECIYKKSVGVIKYTEKIFNKKAFYIGVVIAIVSCTYIFLIPKPQMVYVNEQIVNEGDPVKPEYLSENDVKGLIRQGNIVKDYQGSLKPMYAYYGNVALIEYFRKMISIDLWLTILLYAGYVIVSMYREKGKKECA